MIYTSNPSHPDLYIELARAQHIPILASPSKNLQARIHAWNKLANTAVAAALNTGFSLPFKDTPPQRIIVPNYDLTPPQITSVRQQLTKFLAFDSIARTTQQPLVCSPLFVVPKANGGFRLVIDLRILNDTLDTPKFKAETLFTATRLAATYSHATTLDVASAFHHVPVSPRDRTYLGFQFDGQYYVWNVMPFGLQTSPWAWHVVMAQAIRLIRVLGVAVVWYVDDLMILGASAQDANYSRRLVVQVLEMLGIKLNDKGIDTPTTRFIFLGFLWDLTAKMLAVTPAKRDSVRTTARRMLQRGGATRSQWRSFAGLVMSLTPACAVAPLYLRPIFNLVGENARGAAFVRLTEPVRQVLAFWARFPDKWTRRPMRVPATITALTITFDASSFAWGAFLTDGPGPPTEARGFFTTQERAMFPVHRETLAFLRALQSFPRLLHDRLNLLIQTDSQPLAAALRRTSSRSPYIYRALAQVLPRLWANGSLFRVQWLSSENNPADAPSRFGDKEDFALLTHWFQAVCDLFAVSPTVDRFASSINTRCRRFNSEFLCPGVEAVDAFRQWWATVGEVNWANPPFSLLLRVLLLILEQGAETVLVTPLFPDRLWWPLLMRMASQVLIFPRAPLFFSGEEQLIMPPPPFRVAAWHIPARHPNQLPEYPTPEVLHQLMTC